MLLLMPWGQLKSLNVQTQSEEIKTRSVHVRIILLFSALEQKAVDA